jgi:pSer/pThr/pTyr-binding forkhead associated (FHA) protein
MGGNFIMDKCPYCGAETRQGDNFCLNCGNRLLPATPSPAQPAIGEPTLAATPEDWKPSAPSNIPLSSGAGWGGSVDPNALTAASPAADVATVREPAVGSSTSQATLDRIAEPANFILRSDSGEVLQEYPLDKPEIIIGRAPTSDILLSKDKLTSRRHAVVTYENGQYLLHDEHSANGTFVNGQQLEDSATHLLRDGDQVGIGEHELVFRASGARSNSVEDLPTMAVPYESVHPEGHTYSTQSDPLVTMPTSSDDYRTVAGDYPPAQDVPMSGDTIPHEASDPSIPVESYQPVPTFTPQLEEPVAPAYEATQYEPEPAAPAYVPDFVPVTPEKTPLVAEAPAEVASGEVTFSRFSALSSPSLPDLSALTAALSSLDGQIMALQQQFNQTQEAMRSHDSEVTQTANQLRTGIRRVSERMDNMIADVARNREALSWSDLLQLMEDVMNNPRDIEYVTKLARKARELNKVFQIHQNVLNTMAECNSLLRSMIGDEHR